MIKLTDQQIVDQLKNGDTKAFKALYADFEKITNFVTQNSGKEEDAKDFFHETLIVFYEKIINDEFELKSKLSTYLYSVCKNLWLYHLRSNKPMIYNSINKENASENWEEQLVNVEDNSEEKEEILNSIIQKIDELKEPCYSILMMFYFKKLDYKTIAQKLNYKSEKVVKNQKYRCIQKLKESLSEQLLEMY
ncbi:RNA polymerase sigma factor [Bacteroidota bacterium]